ncbi:MAG: hypothetical protein KY393_02910 [Actinobacteria bacterium]|nr:hypothetical protein [Actinomycetota bacterium]
MAGLKNRKNQNQGPAGPSAPKPPKEPKKNHKGLGALSKLIPKADAPAPAPKPSPPPSIPKPNPNARRFTAPYNYIAPTAGSAPSSTTPAAPKGSPHSPWNPTSSFRPSMPGVPTPPKPASHEPSGGESSSPPRGYTPPADFHPSTSPYAYRPEDPAAGSERRPFTTPADLPDSSVTNRGEPNERSGGTPDLSIFGGKVPLAPQGERQPAAEPTAEAEPTQQMPEVSRALEAVDQAAGDHYDSEQEAAQEEPADSALPERIEPWRFEHPAEFPPAVEPQPDDRSKANPRRTQSAAWDELAPEMRSDRPARPLYRIEDPMVKDEPRSAIEQEQPAEYLQLRFANPQLRFDVDSEGPQLRFGEDLADRYEPTTRSEPPAEAAGPASERESADWRYEPEGYENETRLFGGRDHALVDWAAIDDAEHREAGGHAGAEPKNNEERVLQWQSGGEQVVAAERRASILKNTSAKAKVKAADEAMIVEDGLVYVLVDDEGQPVLN